MTNARMMLRSLGIDTETASLFGGVVFVAAWFVAAMAAASLAVAAETDPVSTVQQTVAENILLHQRSSGGWPKHYDRRQVLDKSKRQRVVNDRSENDATIDNGATHTEIRLLAKIFRKTNDPRFEVAALRGIRYLLSGQYDHGGWPQRFPKPRGYSRYITFNDNAMIGVMGLLNDIAKSDKEFSFVPVAMRVQCRRAVERGIECILKCQISVDGTPTVWCAQHDHVTFEPRKARSYELPSLSGAESVGIVRFLTQIEDPSDEVTRAIENAVGWFQRSKLEGIKVVRVKDPTKPKGFDKVVMDDPKAPPMWARFYDIETNQPIFCSRDGIPRRTLAEISYERRNGYSWLGYYAEELLETVPAVDSPSSRPVAEEPGTPHADRRQIEDGRPSGTSSDWRRLDAGLPIPDEGYCDQPYVIVMPDGNWLCTMTTGPGREGEGGQHIVSTKSADHGKTWSPLVAIEPTDGPAASWVVPLLVPSGRVYGFYTYNGDRVETLPGQSQKIRADTLGWYCFKYSDDSGRSWSTERHRLPMRVTACDRANNWQGKVQIFWGIDKPKVSGSSALFAFTKLGRYMLEDGEGWMFRSVNILHEPDVQKLRWELLPEGDHGIRLSEFGSVQEEHNLVPIDDSRLYMVYRTTKGYPCQSYSDDQGHTWTSPEPMTYSPGGRRIKTSRACPKLWRCENGKYLFWFHNHGGRTYEGRNPAWICGGEVRDGQMFWSQPEILLYHEDPTTRMSYPDLIEQDGDYWVTETQKSLARVHALDGTLLDGVWQQGLDKTVPQKGLMLGSGPGTAVLPGPLNLAETRGLALEAWLTLGDLSQGQILVDSRDASGRGLALLSTEGGTIRLQLSDGDAEAVWDCDPGLLRANRRHHVVAIVDAGPKIISFVIDGQLCDGGDRRQYGWGRFETRLGDVSGAGEMRIASAIERLRIYGRYLRTSEAVSAYHAGQESAQ